jgi:hypothetical protein
MSTELFPSNGCCTVACLHRCYLAMGLHFTIFLNVVLVIDGVLLVSSVLFVRVKANLFQMSFDRAHFETQVMQGFY